MKKILSFLVVCFIAITDGRLTAAVNLAAPFSDNAVLQCGKPISVWGSADPGEQVKVEFKGQTKTTKADDKGCWAVKLDALPASAEPAKLVVTGRNSITVDNVLVGEVWLCSGQSNMNFPLKQAKDAEREIADAKYPLIRYFEVKSEITDQPLDVAGGEWEICTPATAGKFTAVGYFFAREIQDKLKVPIGIIKSTLGGSPIESWMSAETLAGTPASSNAFKAWSQMSAGYLKRTADYEKQFSSWEKRKAEAKASGKNFSDPKPIRVQERSDRGKPSGLYNGFIHPLKSLTLAGFLWYQGEGNAGNASGYRLLFPMMISQWRKDFQQGDLPFLFVQLAGYAVPKDKTGQSWAWQREAQASTLSLPNVGMAVAVDVGDPANIHPANKQDVGRRLALVALHKVYGGKGEDSGPVFTGMKKEGSSLRIIFANAEGLRFGGKSTKDFVIAGNDQKFIPAEAHIDGQTVVVSVKEINEPEAVRFDWNNNPESFLFNGAGLPAAPFRSDNW